MVTAAIASQPFLSLPKPKSKSKSPTSTSNSTSTRSISLRPDTGRRFTIFQVAANDFVSPVLSEDSEADVSADVSDAKVVGGLGSLSFEGGVGGAGYSSSASGLGGPTPPDNKELERIVVDRAINATIVLACGSFAITKLLTIDHDYWHGWTIFEILRYAPQHNWSAYEETLKTNPVLAKMAISGVVYSIGDWIAQCYEGKPIFEFDRARMFRSGLVGFTLHGSLSHYYYHICEALFPFDDWWVVPAKVAFDQTVWSGIWNSIYFTLLGVLRLESPGNIFSELKATFWPMLTAGWKLWPFAHLITYGVIPVEQRLLWVDCVELVWVTILSTFSNEKSEARISEAAEANVDLSNVHVKEE